MVVILVRILLSLFFFIPALAKFFTGALELALRIFRIALEFLACAISVAAGLTRGVIGVARRIPIARKGKGCDQNHKANVRIAHGIVLLANSGPQDLRQHVKAALYLVSVDAGPDDPGAAGEAGVLE
jgi:hypothetical protein